MTNNSKISHHSEIEVLNQLLTAQAILHVFPDEKKIGEFIVEALHTIPGVMGSAICLRSCTCVSGIPESEISSIKESLKNIAEEQNHFSVNIPEKAKRIVISLQTIERLYGFVFISIENSINFENYKNAINNFINIVALELENRRQKAQLLTQQFQLEETVKKKANEINKRKNTEKKIKESEEKYRFIIDGAKDGIIHIEKNLKVLNVNPAFTEITGISKETIIGKSGIALANKFVNIKQLPFILNYLKNIRKNDPIDQYELFYQDKILEISSSKQENGQRVAIIRDITKRKKADNELKESKERYKGIIQNTNSSIAVYKAIDDGKDFVFVGFNPAAEKTDKISKENVIGKKVTELFPSVKEFGLLEVIQKVWKTGKPQNFPLSVYKDHRIQGYRENYVYKLSTGEIVAIYQDLTEQKKADEMIAKSELKFRLLASNTYDWEYWVDQNGKYVFISDSCEEISGYSAADFYDNNQLLLKLVHPDYVEMVKAHYQSEEEKETPKCNMEFSIINRKGELRWIEHNCSPVFDEDGNFGGRRGNNRDITDSKLVDQALKESEILFKNSERAAHLGSWEMDLDTARTKWSDEFFRICGFVPGSIEPSTEAGYNIIHPDDREKASQAVEDSITNNVPYEIEKRIVRPDGTIRWVRSIGKVYTNRESKSRKLTGSFLDITDRRKAEKALKEREKQLSSIYDAVGDVVFLLSVDSERNYRFISVNRSFCTITGLAQESIINKRIDAIIPEPSLSIVLEKYNEAIKKKKLVRWEETTDYPNGILTGDVSIAPVFDENGKCTHLVGSVHDITERKKSEEKINEAHKQLEELYQHQDVIKENERKAISREIHDELGQLLTALKIDLFWTKERIGDNVKILEKITGMIDIVSETIKTVQRISSELRPSLLDDLGLVPAIEWYVQEFEKRTNINCQIELEEIELDNTNNNLALFRIVQEAFTNIIRHANAKNARVAFYRNDAKISLEISDDGIGMKEEKINSHQSLGIKGIQERVKQFNGYLDISSELDKGTKIMVVIPCEK